MKPVSKGLLFPECSFDGIVHSVFRHAVNIQLSDWDKTGILISLLHHKFQNAPNALRVAEADGTDWRGLFTPASTVYGRGGTLRFCGGVPIKISSATVPIWTAPCPEVSIRPAKLRVHWKEIDQCLTSLAPAGASFWCTPFFPKSLNGLRTREKAEAAVFPLIGAGSGLTPSGDDYLIGLLLILQVTEPDCHKVLASTITRHLSRTTHVSASYLKLAAKGHFSEALTDLRQAIFSSCPTLVPLQRAISRVLAVGSTSGADTLAGVRAALASATPAFH